MTTLTSRLNISSRKINGAYYIQSMIGMSCYDTLCLICSELDINLTDISDEDFEAAADVLENFKNAANDDCGYSCSIWFDAEDKNDGNYTEDFYEIVKC